MDGDVAFFSKHTYSHDIRENSATIQMDPLLPSHIYDMFIDLQILKFIAQFFGWCYFLCGILVC